MRPIPRHQQPPAAAPSDHRESLSFRNQPPPATPQYLPTGTSTRDSDVSFCSSRPSHSSKASDKSSMLRSINAYLSSHNLPIALSSKPLPSAKDVSDTLRFLLSRLHFSPPRPNSPLDDDLLLLIKALNCPHKITKSALRAPAAPHAFPQVLALLHWLVQLADYFDYITSHHNPNRASFLKDPLTSYAVNSYLLYMGGDDEGVEALDNQFTEKMEKERESLANKITLKEEEARELELQLEEFKTKPSEREVHERKRKDLEGDVLKFQEFVSQVQNGILITEKALEEKKKELDAKVQEIKRIREENEELKKRIDAQGFNMRDAERMKRELSAVEREISEFEANRNSLEEKISDVDQALRQKIKELEALSIDCNQALRRLKLGVDFQYVINADGSTPAEVIGVNYKTILKTAINSFAEEKKKSTTAKFEELIALQQQSKEMAARIEAKKNRLAALQLHIDDCERQFEVTRNEIEEYTSWCASEAQRIKEEMEREAYQLDLTEREATETLEAAKLELHEVRKQCERERKDCENELFALIDLVSKCKEDTEKKLSDMRKDLSETTEFMANVYKNTLSS